MKILEKEKRVIKKSTLIKIILLCLVLIAMLVCFSVAKKVKREKQIVLANGDMELLRAMSYEELNNSDELTNSDFVRFSAFFLRDTDLDGYANKIKGTAKEVGTSDTLYMSLAVLAEGTLKDGTIEIIGENFYFQTALIDDEVIDGNYIDANTSLINLKDVRVGTQKLFFGNVRSGNYSNGQHTAAIGNDISKYSKVNKVILRGVHVKDDGTETYVVKEVEFPVDWYSTVKTEIPFTYAGDNENKYQHYGIGNLVDEKNQIVKTTFKVVAQEINNKLLLSKSYIEAEIPLLNDYEPLTVEVKGTNIGFEYDPVTRIVKAYRDATVNGDLVTSQAYAKQYHNTRYNEYEITVTYPLEAYTTLGVNVINLVVPVRAYYEGFNNPNEEFGSPIRSNLAEDVINITYEYGGGDVVGFNVQVGKYVQNPYDSWVVSKAKPDRAYNNHMQEDFEYEVDRYDVLWEIGRGKEGTVSNIIARETDKNPTDQIITTDNRYIDIDDFVKNVGLYLYVPGLMLGENGYVDVFNDETNELIHRFTSEDWDLYTKENPYMYETPIAHVRIETGAAANNSYFAINHIKEIDNEYIINNIPEEEFEKYRLISSHLAGYVKFSENDESFTHSKDDVERANYDLQKSVVSFGGISPAYFTTQEVKENVKLTIKTQELVYNTISWVNGEFLVKLPKEILTLDINSVTVSNPGVKVLGYSLDEKEDGWYLKILTENPNTAYTYDIVIDCNLTPDPRIISSEQIVTIYAINEIATSYLNETKDIYDVDSDGNTDEYIGVATGKINFIGPTSLITMEAATEYNSNHDRLETTIAPQIAIIDKAQSEKTAVIQASILNNYSNTISEIKLVGKIPFEGNTFQLIEKDLGSMYTTKLLGQITVPEALRDYAKVYYSENEVVNEDLNDLTNNWIPENEVIDYSKFKSYLIDLGSYTMTKGEKQICEYKIAIPNTVNYNEVAYSTHAVFFSLDTPEGKLRDRTETNKLGFMIARKYNLEINKTKQGTETYIKGATFSVIEEDESNKSKIVTTNISGQISILDLYVDKVYTIKEIKSPYDYVLNPQEIKVKATVNEETGELEVTKLSGETKNEVTVQDREHGKTVVVNIENEPKYTLKLTKTVEGTEEVIKGVRFRIYGKGLATAGRTATTNKDGLITVTGLYPGETYTIVEEYAKGYEYSTVPVEFRAVWDGNVLVPESISGSFNKETVIDNNQIGQPIMTTGVTNIKLREYSFGLTKYEKDTTKKLANATFRITGKWLDEEIVTDENGYLEIPTLYEGIEYTLEEILAPEGYAVNENKVKFIGTFDEDGKLNIQVTGGTLITSREIIAKKEAKEEEKNNSTEGDQNVENKVENTVVENTVTEDNIENTIENKVENIVEPDPENPVSLSDEDETVETTYGTVVDSTGTEVSKVEVKIEQKDNGNLVFKLGYEDEPLFKLTKYDGTTMESLPNVKFAIKKINDDGTESDAIDTNGNLIGEEEKINDVKYRVIKTDSKGEITADLPEGLYKVIEVETLAAYVLPEDIAQRTYTFGIGKSKPAVKEFSEEWNKESFEGTTEMSYVDVIQLEDNSSVAVGTFTGTIRFDENLTETGEEIIVVGAGASDVVLIKYNEENLIKYAVPIGDNHNNYVQSIIENQDGNIMLLGSKNIAGMEYIYIIEFNHETGEIIRENIDIQIGNGPKPKRIVELVDGGYIIVGEYNNLLIPENMSNIGEIAIKIGKRDGLVLKISKEWLLEWYTTLGGNSGNSLVREVIEKNDGTIMCTAYLTTGTYLVGEDSLDIVNSEAILNLDSNGTVIDIKLITGYEYDRIKKVNDGYIVAGRVPYSGVYITVNGQSQRLIAGSLMVKYDKDDNIEWFSQSNVGYYITIYDVIKSLDDGYILVGDHLVTPERKNHLIVKVDRDGKMEFSNSFGSLPDDKIVAILNNNITGGFKVFGNYLGVRNDTENIGAVITEYDLDGNIIETKELTKMSQQYNSIIETDDGGYIAVGKFTGRLTFGENDCEDGLEKNFVSKGNSDSLIVKFNSFGNIEWVNSLGGANDDNFVKIENYEDGYLVCGTYLTSGYIGDGTTYTISADKTLNNEEIILKSNGRTQSLIIKYTEEGLIEWIKQIGGSKEDYIYGIFSTGDGYIAVGYYTSESIEVDGNIINRIGTGYNTYVIKYNLNNEFLWGNSYSEISGLTDVEILDDNSIILNNANRVVKVDLDTKEILYDLTINRPLGGTASDCIIGLNDGEILLIGRYLGKITVSKELFENRNEDYTCSCGAWGIYVARINSEGKIIDFYSNLKENHGALVRGEATNDGGYIITANNRNNINANGVSIYKYNSSNVLEGTYKIDNNVNDVIQCENGKYIVVGYKVKNQSNTASISKLEEHILEAEIPAQQLFEIANYKKELNITTEVKVHDDGTKGGTISGEGESPYEVVVYGENATKDIVITPDENYKILTLTINDVAYPYTIEDDGTVRINLENVTENKHIVVGFSNTISEVLVHHYIDGTEDKVADDQSIVGMIGARYTTAPAMDLEDYEVIVEKIPETASGMFTADVQEVIYYYQEKKVMVTVNHYLEGTTDKLSESTIREYLKGEEYSTTKADDINVKYELVAVPSNSTGTVTDNLTVNYYYRVKKYNITTKVEGTGGDITGSGNITLEEVEHGDDSTTEIVITPEEGFYVENVTINGTPVDFITGPNNIVTLDKFIGMDEDKDIIVTFERTEGQVIVHHYIEGTTDKVPSNVEGEVVEDEIKIGYVGDSFATMESANIAEYYELSSKSEETSGVYTEATQEVYYYYKLKQYNYTVEYYYDGELDSSKVDVITATWGDVIDTYTDKNITGYTLEKEENLPLTITQEESTNVIKVYYVKDKFNYTVEYYFEGVIDSTKTDVIEATYQDEIKTYQDKVEVGYKLDRVETLPMVVTEVEENNIIKVYYVIDENQTKDLSYKVEYYKDGVLVSGDTQIESETVQILDDDILNVDKSKINLVDKYYGYKLDAENTIVANSVTTGAVIRVYYVTDDGNTKNLSYTVEYYKDGIKVDADTDIKTITVQVLQPDTLNVDKAAINMVDKYVGYKFEKVEPTNIPDTVTDGTVIKVYYVRDTFEYRMEYYFNGVIDDTLTDTYTALYNEQINDHVDKVKVGYTLERVDPLPLTVTEVSEDNVMRIYYVTDENQTKDLSYTVEYYKDNMLVLEDTEVETETVQVLEDNILNVDKTKINVTNKYVGYKLDTENTIVPDSVTTGEVIKVYYVRDTFAYSMEYYFNGIKDETLTDNYTALYNEKINDHIDKVKVGYTLDKVEPLPLTVAEDAVNNVMRIYYITDELQTKELSYTVEYYKDGVKEDSDTQIETITVQVLQPDIMTVDKTKINLVDKYFGYKLDSTTVVPDIVNSGDVIKVYYVVDENQTKELSYTVEYYKDGVLVSGDTQTESEIVQVLEDDKMVVRTANINMTNKYVGYKFEKTEPTVIPDEVDTGVVIKVYYVRDTFDYSVEYYFNGVIDTSLTDTMSALFGDVIDTYEDKVKIGYRLNKVETLPMTVTENSLNNVIRVYYVTDDAQTKDLRYTVEYYKDGVKVNSDTQIETETVQLLEDDKLVVRKENINTTNKYVGYKFEGTEPSVIPDEVDTDSVIKVYYVKDNFDYTIEYYYDGIKDDSKTEVGSALFESTIDTYTDKVIEGYVFEKVEGSPITIDSDITKNVMKVYYTKRTDLSYTVKYLEEGTNNVLAQEKVVNNQTFKDTVTENAIDIEGYNKVQSTKSIEITTGVNEIIFYYTKRNDLSYRVEYYFDNVIDNALTETVNNQVYDSVIDTYQDKVKVGYKLDFSTAPITIGVEENVIKVYYVTDETQTKELSYTVEYYKDGVRVDSDTQIETEIVQILDDNIMDVNLSKINVVNKYVGHKLSALDPVTLPSQVESGAVIRVYYIRDSYNYTVEYYYNNVIDSNATERINAKYNDEITTYEDKVKPGYKLDRAEVPFTVTEVEENNVIRVYYVTDDAQIKELSYTVEYYEDGVLADTEVEKETVQLLEDDRLAVRKENINMTNKYVGYKFEKVEPENIPDEVDTGSVIKVYYVRDTFGYTIEYYYNNVIDDTLTENKTALYGDKIETFTNNVKDGYIQGKVENIPLIVTEDETQNIMRVFYEIDPTQVKELSYTVEYYKDGVKVDTDTQIVSKTVQLLDNNIIEVNVSDINTTDKYVGYRLENTEPNVIPTEVVTGSVIKVYYVKDNFDYTVEYYYENVIEPSKTDVISATYQDVIDTYTDKVITGYEFDRVEGTPLTITENESTNVIKVYYKKARFAYTVEYYYDGNINDSKTETLEGIYDERIESYTSKEEYGYKFDGVFNLPLRISENEEKNVIKVYYVRKDSTVSVQFVDKISGNTISPEVVKEGKVFDTFDITNDVKEIEGYTLIESPSTLTGTFEEEVQSFTYYYAKISNVVVKYLEEDTNVELLPEENIVGYESKEYSTTRKDVANYTFVKDTENTTGVMTDRTITVIYYYAQNTKVTVNYIDKNTGAILDQVVVPGKVGDEYTSAAKDITYYVLVQSPVRETVTMTKDEIVLEYYYVHVSAGVIEKHIDIKSGELLDNKEYVGNEGDSYTTNNKTFDGYDLVVKMLPENASGTMTIDVIEVKYYYIRRTMVIVEYVDNLTDDVLKDFEGVDIDGDGLIDDIVEVDSTVVIEGHEGDNYITEEKSFDGYDLVMEKYPTNSKGIMGVVDEDGKTTVVTKVTYYYALKTKVTVSYIDVMSGEVIDTEVINGHEGDEYETERKEIDGYDIVIESVPENEKGTMTEEPIEVKYYYRAKATVTVNHIDNYTGKELLEIDSETKAEVDSSVVINGHEGDEYNTSSKSFKGYELREDKLPGNSKGYMTKGDIVVNYYYSYKSSVKVLYIEKATGNNITDSVLIEGYEGDSYKAVAKDVSGYKLIEVPGEESGKIIKEQKTLVYYYEKLSGGVKINYIDIHNNNNMLGGETITGIVGDSFEANFKQFEGYELVIERLPSSNKGTLQEGVIEINYYYRKIGTDVTTPVITPPTGDSIINGLIVVAYTVLTVNVITLIKKKRNAKK